MFAARELRFKTAFQQLPRLLWLLIFIVGSASTRADDQLFKTGKWPFRPLTRPTVPSDTNSAASNPIDRLCPGQTDRTKAIAQPPP